MKRTLSYDRRQLNADLLSLAHANLWRIGWWLVTVALFLLTVVGSTGAGLFLTCPPRVVILTAMALAGIVPLAVALFWPLGPSVRLSLSSVLVLVGGFLVRYAIVTEPQVHRGCGSEQDDGEGTQSRTGAGRTDSCHHGWAQP